MTPDAKERYVRWQDYRITQFSFVINLFLTFVVAALGFSFALVKETAFYTPAWRWMVASPCDLQLLGFGSIRHTCYALPTLRLPLHGHQNQKEVF